MHRHFIRISTALVLMLTSAVVAQGFAPGSGLSAFGGAGRGLTILKGNVLCARCTLEDVQKGQPTLHHLYQLTHKQGQVVLQVKTINGAEIWESPLSPRFAVRAQDRVFEQLTAEENLMKEVEVTGSLGTTQTLDIFTVTIQG
jgi:hypothetical protein